VKILEPSDRWINLTIAPLFGTLFAFSGCSEQPPQLDQGWTRPVSITSTEDADAGGGNLYKWRDTLILLKDQYDRSTKSSTCSIMIRNKDSSNSWTQLPPLNVPSEHAFFYPTFDEAHDRIIFERGHIENDQLLMSAIFARISESGRIQVEAEKKWTIDKKSLFGVTGTNVQLTGLDWNAGVINDSEIYLPYNVRGETHHGNLVNGDEGPFNNGVFHSTDSGATWRMERISDFESFEPSVRKTKGYYYYIASKNSGLSVWFSRKPVNGDSWDEPKLLTKTSANRRGGGVLAENDTIHYCRLDCRHEKSTLNFAFPLLGNYEVVYCQRKDSDSTWSKDIILSKGLLFSYWPSISVEGDKIVVVWQSGEPNYKAHTHRKN
jgi:hypothetical protein